MGGHTEDSGGRRGKLPVFRLWKSGGGSSDRDHHHHHHHHRNGLGGAADEELGHSAAASEGFTETSKFRTLVMSGQRVDNLTTPTQQKPPVVEWLFSNNNNSNSGDISTDSVDDSMQRDVHFGGESKHRDVADLSDAPYDYRPFFDKNLVLNESKIDRLMETERAEHCLVFHRSRDHDANFRPDLEVDCGQETVGDSGVFCGSNGNVLISYPGMQPLAAPVSAKSRSPGGRTTTTARRIRRMQGTSEYDSSDNEQDNNSSNNLQNNIPFNILTQNGHMNLKLTNSNSNSNSTDENTLAEFWEHSPLTHSLGQPALEELQGIVAREVQLQSSIAASMAMHHDDVPLQDKCHRVYKNSRWLRTRHRSD